MAVKTFQHLPSGPILGLGTISVHISSTNTRVFSPESVTNYIVQSLQSKLDIGTLRLETVFEATRKGVQKTVKVVYIVSSSTLVEEED